MGRPLVIAHRGASGYLPEHTLAAKALAVAMGADYLEQDVIATRDGELIVFHDLTLEQTTDVRTRFPGRARADGRFYCIDFTLAELRTLNLGERLQPGGSAMRFPSRFPSGSSRFGLVTLSEELEFVQGLEKSTGGRIGIYPEIKDPAWHREAGIDLSARMLEVLQRFGYRGAGDRVFVQCFDPAELQRVRTELGCGLKLVQLIDSSAGTVTAANLARIAAYADAIGPSIKLIYKGRGEAGPVLTSLVADAHAAGLAVHPYTFRKDDLPEGIASFEELLRLFVRQLGVDGLFTDYPDLVSGYARNQAPG